MSEPFVQYNRSILEINEWQCIQPDLKVGFTTRNGGTSQSPFHTFNLGLHVNDHQEDVISNRQTLARTIGIPLSHWVCGTQVHGNQIKVITSDDLGRGSCEFNDGIQGIDGFITNKRDLLCTAFFADCVPLFFFRS